MQQREALNCSPGANELAIAGYGREMSTTSLLRDHLHTFHALKGNPLWRFSGPSYGTPFVASELHIKAPQPVAEQSSLGRASRDEMCNLPYAPAARSPGEEGRLRTPSSCFWLRTTPRWVCSPERKSTLTQRCGGVPVVATPIPEHWRRREIATARWSIKQHETWGTLVSKQPERIT